MGRQVAFESLEIAEDLSKVNPRWVQTSTDHFGHFYKSCLKPAIRLKEIRECAEATSVNSGTVPILFPIPHRPTKLLLAPAACNSLKIHEVASRALASLLITERGNGGNRAGKCAAAEATLATSLRFSRGEQAKKIPTDKGWDFKVLVVEYGTEPASALRTPE